MATYSFSPLGVMAMLFGPPVSGICFRDLQRFGGHDVQGVIVLVADVVHAPVGVVAHRVGNGDPVDLTEHGVRGRVDDVDVVPAGIALKDPDRASRGPDEPLLGHPQGSPDQDECEGR